MPPPPKDFQGGFSDLALFSFFSFFPFFFFARKLATFFCSFRSSACANYQWILPLPPRGVLLTAQV
jgi:hypothetical protein